MVAVVVVAEVVVVVVAVAVVAVQVVVVVAVVVDFSVEFLVAVNRPVVPVVHRTHFRRIRNKPTTPAPDRTPTPTTDGPRIRVAINTIRIRDMVITTIRHHLLPIGDHRRTTVRLIISNHKMFSEHFIQLAAVKISFHFKR